MQTLRIERHDTTQDINGACVPSAAPFIRFTIGTGGIGMSFDMPTFLSSELVKIATDPDAKPFVLENH